MRRRRRVNQTLPPNLYTEKHKGTVYFRYRDPLTGERTGFGTDRADAIRAALHLNSTRVPPETCNLIAKVEGVDGSMDSWLDRYWQICETERELAANTLRSRKSIVKGLREAFGAMPLVSIETKQIADHLNALRASGKARSAQAYRSTLLDVFKTAIAEGWTKHNPVEVTRSPTVTVQRSRLTFAQFQTILEAAVTHKEPYVANSLLLALVTAQRVEDIAEMRFDHVSGDWLHVEQGKTGNRVRIALGVRLRSLDLTVGDAVGRCRDRVLSRHLVHHTRSYRGTPAGSPVHQNTVSRGFQWARDRSGLRWDGPPPTFHEIRSLSGRLYKEQGSDPQAILGHKDARTTAMYTDVRGAEWIEIKG